ncbi:D-sedoheptulose-7-phosphate isomerase [Calycomorphotria hydatis]|uniref:Phosphoheptose isomerase n=1 Tax=Calycomorphotria hydatis TaxID=2528027 RepID=A0A517TEF6_9PLAN|nr:D-sedoheptulose 7-phosphate isomerase [Calycomorphotria hydatis]QDT66749.1 Phosphoheptose isomerase [Calycomorphotria hydatis]
MSQLERELTEHNEVFSVLVDTSGEDVDRLVDEFIRCHRNGGKSLLFGNGGSAADAQHVAAELVNRLRFDRPAMASIALTTDTSVLTCVGNDASYEMVFARQVEALAKPGDIVIGISTSGTSKNVVKGLEAAREAGAVTVGFTGAAGREKMAPLCDLCVAAPTNDTARIQEAHIFLWHVICGAVESTLFNG